MGINIEALVAAKKFTSETVLGGGAVVGKNVTISSITPIEGGNKVTFSYTLDDGTVKTSTMDVIDGKDGVSVVDIDVNANNQIVFTMSDDTEFISGKIPTVKGDTGEAGTNGKSAYELAKNNGFTGTEAEWLASLKGADGVSPTATVEKVGKVATITITDKNGTTTATIKDGQGGTGGSGEENTIDSISVNGVNVLPDENKNVDITVPSIEGLTKDADLATVAKSGDYEDLINKPIIPDITGLATESYVTEQIGNIPSVDLTDYAKTVDIPTTVAELTDSADYAKKTDVNNSISTLQTNKANTSDLTAHTGDSVIHVTAENKTLWNTVSNKVNKEDGKALLADTDKTNYDDAVTKAHTHENKEVLDGITSDKVTAWDNKSEFSGSYNDLNDKPTIDAELSNTSENAIQNKVVTKEINKLYSDISFNDFDTATDGTSFTDAEDGNMIVTDWTKNLLNPTLETTTQNGVTCTRNVDANGNPDGTYTLNGTATGQSVFWMAFSNCLDISKLDAETDYKIICSPYGGTFDTYRTDFKINENLLGSETPGIPSVYKGKEFDISGYLVIVISNGYTCNNLTFKPMLTTDLSATYDDFVPYSGYDIKSYGKNLIDFLKIPFTCNLLSTYTINNGILDISCNETDNSGIFFVIHKDYNAFMRRKFKISFDVKASVGGKFNIGAESIKMNLFDVGTEYERKVLEFEGVLNGYFDFYNMSGVSQHLYLKDFMIEIVDEFDGIPTAYEPYTGETITVTNDTESPAFGLKSHKGLTHIISPGNVKCVYPTNESGKGVLDSLYNKDKMLTEQNKNLGGLTFSASGATLTITDGTNTWTLGANS